MDKLRASKPSRLRGCLLAAVATPVILGAIGAIVKVAGGGATGDHVASDPATLAEEARDTRDNRTLYAGRTAITATMKDPASAVFSRSFAWLKHGERVGCGYVNARNSFGALAGDTQWLFRADSGVGLVRSYANYERFRVQWNRYCVGASDDLKAAPSAFISVKIGARVPSSLRPYDAAKQVWVFRDPMPRRFLGIAVLDPTYMTDQGRTLAAQATAKGRGAYDSLRQKMAAAYGIPTSDSGADGSQVSWDWGRGKILAELTYRVDHNQTTVSLTRQQ